MPTNYLPCESFLTLKQTWRYFFREKKCVKLCQSSPWKKKFEISRCAVWWIFNNTPHCVLWNYLSKRLYISRRPMMFTIFSENYYVYYWITVILMKCVIIHYSIITFLLKSDPEQKKFKKYQEMENSSKKRLKN